MSTRLERFKKAGLMGCLNGVQTEAMEWISVEEQLPKPHQNVLLISMFGSYYIGNNNEEEIEEIPEWEDSNGRWLFFITHWMPLPNAPKK